MQQIWIVIAIISALFLYQYGDILKRLQYDKIPDENTITGLCLSGKNPSTLTKSQQLIEFKKGPCSPIVLVPGFLGTSLVVEIDCKKLKKNLPKLFSDCGWNTCDENSYFGSKPKNQYTLWVSDIFDKLSILQLKSSSKCFGDILGLDQKEYDKGLRVTWKGDTPYQKDPTNICGRNAIQDLAESTIFEWSSCQFRGFESMILMLEKMGYQSGVTYQAIPYDFRKSIKQIDTDKILKNTFEKMAQLVGRKVIVLGHSYGNLHIWNALNNMTQTQKNNYVQQYIALEPPFLGSQKLVQDLINGGDQEFLGPLQLGMTHFTQMEFLNNCPSAIDLMPRQIPSEYRNQDWLMAIQHKFQQKIEQEEKNKFEMLAQFLQLESITYFLEKSIFYQVQNRTYFNTKQDLIQILYELSQTQKIADQYEQLNISNFKQFEMLQNPGVDMIVMYGNYNKKTTRGASYQTNPKSFLNKGIYVEPTQQLFQAGDGSIGTSSSLIPSLIWAHEKFTGKSQNSIDRQIWIDIEQADILSQFTAKPQILYGVDCEANHLNKGLLQHSCAVNDKYLLKFLYKTFSQQKNSQTTSNIDETQITDKFVEQMQNRCPYLNKFS